MARHAILGASVGDSEGTHLDRAVRLAGQVFVCDFDGVSDVILRSKPRRAKMHVGWWALGAAIACLVLWQLA